MPKGRVTYSKEYHWRLAAESVRKSWEEFLAQDGPEMSKDIAFYETKLQLEAVMATESIRESRRKAAHGSRGSRS